MELICGACQGRLLAELPGTTVACPHCGTHLLTPAAEPAPQTQGAILIDSGVIDTGDGPASGADPENDTVRMDIWVPPEPTRSADVSPELFMIEPSVAENTVLPIDTAPAESSAPEIVAAVSDIPLPATTASPGDAQSDSPIAPPTSENATSENSSAAQDGGEIVPSAGDRVDDPHKTTIADFVVNAGSTAIGSPAGLREASNAELLMAASVVTDSVSSGSPEFEANPLAESAAAMASLQFERNAAVQPVKQAPARSPVRAGVSPTIFMIVVSYASAMTLACLYLAFLLLSNPRTYDLPDLVPPPQKDKKSVTAVMYVSPAQELPPANVLKLGESRQYGSLKVTPLRVTRGPLEFEYYEPEADQQREAEGPVLKLHLRFENVSRDQEFIPLDSKLVFTKKIDGKAYGLLKANNFVCNVADRKRPARLVFTFDLTPNGNWLLKGENLDRDIVPGQVLETFIPTAPDQIESLSGDLVWRVHFRKGYNRKSFRGVTTLIEVLFKNSDIVDEEEPAPGKRVPVDPAKEEPAVKDA